MRKLGPAGCSYLDFNFVSPGAIRPRVASANHDVVAVSPSGNCCDFVDLFPIFYSTGGARGQFSLVDGRGRWTSVGFRWLSRFFNAECAFFVGHSVIPSAGPSEFRILNSSFPEKLCSNHEGPTFEGASWILSIASETVQSRVRIDSSPNRYDISSGRAQP
jgi:hypothetical protein